MGNSRAKGSRTRKNRYSKPLESLMSKKRPTAYRTFPQIEHPGDYHWVNWERANQAGLFTNQDIDELEQRHRRAELLRSKEKEDRDFKRVTIATATKEQVDAAWHRILMRKRKAARGS